MCVPTSLNTQVAFDICRFFTPENHNSTSALVSQFETLPPVLGLATVIILGVILLLIFVLTFIVLYYNTYLKVRRKPPFKVSRCCPTFLFPHGKDALFQSAKNGNIVSEGNSPISLGNGMREEWANLMQKDTRK